MSIHLGCSARWVRFCIVLLTMRGETSPTSKATWSLLEDGFDSPVLPNSDEPTLIKFLLPHSMSGDVFERLELVNITGASLFGSADGVADDIWNGFNYNRRLYLRTEGRIGG